MPKKILQDIVPKERRSIRHIPLPSNRKPAFEELPSSRRRSRGPRSRLVRWSLIVASVLVLAGAVFASSWFFESATLTVTPKQETASVDVSLQSSVTPALGGLAHMYVTATSTVSQVVPSTGTQNVQQKASGQIVIYNNYSSASQRLIKNTRFETPDGRIYRIDSPVVVPGQHVEGGKQVPGSVTVTVYADAPGPEYNLLLSDLKGDFTIPGLKGAPQYDSFYARAKTDITGGFIGTERVVDSTASAAAVSQMKSKLTKDVWNEIIASLPAGDVTFQSLYGVDFSMQSKDNPSGDGVLVTVTGTGKAVVYSGVALSKEIAKKTLSDYNGEDILITNLDSMQVAPQVGTGQSLWQTDPLTVSFTGNARFVWQFDQKAVIADLAGRSKNDTNAILRKYTAIQQAEVVVKPSWLQNYPSDQSRIHIKINLGASGASE